MSNESDFYIGWQGEAPDGFARRIRVFIVMLIIAIPLTGAWLVIHQQGFANSTFEYGQPTMIEGILIQSPAPFLQVLRGYDQDGHAIHQYILLVSKGKHGIGEMLDAREKTLGHSLENRMVRLMGFLIYHDGKTLMEVEDMHGIHDRGTPQETLATPLPYGQGTVVGEITDPKCLFGVMKPGHGKPHRSCAARCIAGGIPPVLRVTASDVHHNYFILANNTSMPVNQEVIPYVGDQVAICGEIRKLGEWSVLYRDETKQITLIQEGSTPGPVMCR